MFAISPISDCIEFMPEASVPQPSSSRREKEISQAVRDKIANRNNWLRLGVAAVFSVVFAIKLATQPIVINLSDFKFSDLLSLVLAIFSVGLSVVFYLKATDTSNEFYHHSYNFTRDISIVLGRIEATFGERLQHLGDLMQEKGDKSPTIASSSRPISNPESKDSGEGK